MASIPARILSLISLFIRTPVTLLQVCLFDVEAERCVVLCVRAFVSNNKVSWKCKLLSVCLLAFVLRRCAVQSLTIVFRQVYTTSSNDSSDIVLLHTLQQKRVNNSQQLEVGVISNHEACNCSAMRFFLQYCSSKRSVIYRYYIFSSFILSRCAVQSRNDYTRF